MGEGASLYAEVRLGSAAVAVLERAGFRVTLTRGAESGRVQSIQGLARTSLTTARREAAEGPVWRAGRGLRL